MSKVFFSSLTAFAKALGPCLINVERNVPSGGNPCTEASKMLPVNIKLSLKDWREKWVKEEYKTYEAKFFMHLQSIIECKIN